MLREPLRRDDLLRECEGAVGASGVTCVPISQRGEEEQRCHTIIAE